MTPSIEPFIQQMVQAVGENRYWIQQIEAGCFRPHRDGVDITDEFAADARRRLADAKAILASYGR